MDNEWKLFSGPGTHLMVPVYNPVSINFSASAAYVPQITAHTVFAGELYRTTEQGIFETRRPSYLEMLILLEKL